MSHREKIWLWGQNAGAHHSIKEWNLPGENKMTPEEGCRFYDINKCYRVVMGNLPLPPYDSEAEKLEDFKEVVWSVVGDNGSTRTDSRLGEAEEIARLAGLYPNITGGVLDDFFVPKRLEVIKPDDLARMKECMSNGAGRDMKLHIVSYEHLFDTDIDFKAYFEKCDVITQWTWKGSNIEKIPENFSRLRDFVGDKDIYAGLYLWNYGEWRRLYEKEMEAQLSYYEKMLKSNEIQGVIVCSNCVTDVLPKEAEMTKKWIDSLL